MRSHEINVLAHARMCAHPGIERAIWLAGSVEWKHWSPAALCPSFQFPVPALSAARCATEAWNTQVTLPLSPCSDHLLAESQRRSQSAVLVIRYVLSSLNRSRWSGAEWTVMKFRILSSFLASAWWVKLEKQLHSHMLLLFFSFAAFPTPPCWPSN